LPQIKSSLAQGTPVLLTIQVHSGFEKLSGPWKQHAWDWITSEKNPSKGYHAVLIVGYDDTAQRLLVENSWGPHWADGGFFGIPYDMIDSPAFGELWVLNPNYDISWSNENLIKEEKTENSMFMIAILLLCGAIYYFTR
jgi:C1A family cysteine protease